MPRRLAPRDLATLGDILHSCRLITRRVEGRSLDEFDRDEDFQDMVILRLLFVGEAANRLSSESASLVPGVPWPEIRGMRNRLIHGYDSIDLSIVWETAKKDIPHLMAAVESVMAAEQGHTP